MVDAELARERVYLSSLYGRLDELRDEAATQLGRVRLENPGGTHQSRSERDAFARIYEDRIAQLNEVDERLVFGSLQLDASHTASDQAQDAGERLYIGRIGLRDPEQQPLLLDWRVPQASAFYQATAATPLGVRSRRHLTTRGRELLRIDDEIFDSELLDDEEAAARLQGEGALMAALTAQRTGRMHDIVATIQAEQDRIIRSELQGVLVVQGGPGTGKTAVALHRAAYLLYTHRDRLASAGVLVVGPSASFLRYIEAVLPSLGESGVVLASVGQLFPGVETSEEDAPETAALKGRLEMAALVRKAVASRQIVPTETQVIDVNGERLEVSPELIRTAMRKAQESRKPHNTARVTFVKSALSALLAQLVAQLTANGSTVEESDFGYLREDLRTSYDVRVLLNSAWLPLTPEKLVRDLYARPGWLASLTPRWTPEQRALLLRDRDAPLTVSDVPLLDEAAEYLGEYDEQASVAKRAAKAQHKRDVENAENAIRNMEVEGFITPEALASGFAETAARGTTAERAASDREWAYGHVVVDEAQELSPMQWRLLMRRGPMKSFTIVGDMAQASSPAAPSSWQQALEPFVGERFRLEELTVNYRTPAQITRAAEDVAERNGLVVTRSRAVRETQWPVEHVAAAPAGGSASATVDGLVDAIEATIARDRAIDEGTVAVIVPDALEPEVAERLVARLGGDVGRGDRGLSRPVSVLTARQSKGLEFDSVIVVEPQGIVRQAERGAAGLYVAMTRPTQRLSLVSFEPSLDPSFAVG
ncbi:HelD family protein [Compostimonas suwonensis]|uniref:DNA helicase IV n=1 Tax=Compostimonas suwonensis TaxID=1048394 RepID=A0A2M9BTV9_9MICO|nr:ATP-binding domain-containing protein [Compostimonas suwonensis]PJJ61394.1 DNA helicase IV [Compostimonas suwonensis]